MRTHRVESPWEYWSKIKYRESVLWLIMRTAMKMLFPVGLFVLAILISPPKTLSSGFSFSRVLVSWLLFLAPVFWALLIALGEYFKWRGTGLSVQGARTVTLFHATTFGFGAPDTQVFSDDYEIELRSMPPVLSSFFKRPHIDKTTSDEDFDLFVMTIPVYQEFVARARAKIKEVLETDDVESETMVSHATVDVEETSDFLQEVTSLLLQLAVDAGAFRATLSYAMSINKPGMVEAQKELLKAIRAKKHEQLLSSREEPVG